MKLTTLNIFLSLSTLVVGILPVDRTDQVDAEKLYVNPHGEVIIPQEFPWGRYVMKEKDAARNRTTCAGRMDPSGRLGKRQAYCPAGFVLACDAYAASPCCPSDTPVCCSAGTVCCANGQFCQGTSTCCNAGQIGCGEGCCSYGETCCGSKCCSAGMTCDNGTCNAPPSYTTPTYSYVPPTSTTRVTSSTPTSYIPPTYGPGPTRTQPSYSNPYGTDYTVTVPSYTIPIYGQSPPPTYCPTDEQHQVVVVGAAVGACLGAFAIIMAALAAWLWKKKRHAEQELAACQPAKPAPEEPKPYESTPPTKPPATGYEPTTQPPTTGYESTPNPPASTGYDAPKPTTGAY